MKKKEVEKAPLRIEKIKMFLQCSFTEEEMKTLSKELARQTKNVAEAEERKKAAVAQFGEQIASAKLETSVLARKVTDGYEMRDIECEVRLDTPVVGTAQIWRMDLKELVKERAMTPDECQLTLELKPEATS